MEYRNEIKTQSKYILDVDQMNRVALEIVRNVAYQEVRSVAEGAGFTTATADGDVPDGERCVVWRFTFAKS